MLRRRGIPVSSFSAVAGACEGPIGADWGKRNFAMALHRDIYWVGRQWAVTGYGLQACDQKQKSKFDIEASRLWEDGVQERVRALKWLNSEDFDKAISIARKYYPEPARTTPLPENPVAKPDDKVPSPEPPNLVVRKFEMGTEGGRAKFLPVWRIRTRVSGR